MISLRTIFLSLLWLLLSSCGEPLIIRKNEFAYPTSYSNSPIELPKQIRFCRQRFSSSPLFHLHLFSEQRIKNPLADFSTLFNQIWLKDGEVISESVYGEKIEYLKEGENYRYLQHRRKRKMFVCPEVNFYERESIESAALNVSYFVRKTHDHFSSLFPDIPVEPVTINIAPVIIESELKKSQSSQVIKESSYMTDNAMYVPLTKTITFLPHSAEIKNSLRDLNLWEVPMVSAHEYGHHLFQTLYQAPSSLLPHFNSCFGERRKQKSQEKSTRARKISIDDVINAYNEGFADLISFYLLAPQERSVEGVRCLEVSRDVKSSRFYDGKPKRFSKEALQSFFSFFNSIHLGCEDVNYQQVHILGAVFAHSADFFLGQMTNSEDEKLAALVEWVKFLRFERNKYHLASPRIFFRETFTEFLRMSAKHFNRELDGHLCKTVEEIYPDLNLKECSAKKGL